MKAITTALLSLALVATLARAGLTSSYRTETITVPASSYNLVFSFEWTSDDDPYNSAPGRIELVDGGGNVIAWVSGNIFRNTGPSLQSSSANFSNLGYSVTRYATQGTCAEGQLSATWNVAGLAAGSYTVRLYDRAQWNNSLVATTIWTSTNVNLGASSGPPPPAIPVSFSPSPLSFTYNGGAQGPNPNPSPAEASYSTTGTSSATNAGTNYHVEYNGNNGYAGFGSADYTINPASVGFYLTQTAFTYNGGYQAPGVGASGDTNGLSYGTGGTTGAVNAGSYAMNVYTTDGNHTGSSNLSWTINPASQGSVSINPGSASITTGQSITFSAAGGSTGNYSWGGSASGSGATKLVTFNSTGTYSVSVQDAGDGNWYASNVALATITVTQANQAPTIAWYDIPTSFYYGGTEYARASASDADGNLTRIVVEYSTNGGAWQAYTDTSFGATGSSVSPATAFAVGIKPGNYYTFRAQAYDSAGAATGWLYSGNYYPTNRAPTASFSLSAERTLGQTITVTMTVNDADANYSYSNLWIATPNRGWLTIRADNSVVVSGALTPANTSAASAGTLTHTFGFTATDGAGSYTFALAAVDASGARTDAPNQAITITKATQSTAVTSAGGTALYGDSFTASATGGNGSGSYVFELVAGGSASAGAVSSSGVVTASSVGTVLLRAYRAGDTTYNNSAYSPTYTVTFNTRPLIVTLTGSKTYNGTTAPTGAAASITSGTLAGGDSIGYGFANTSSANVGSYPGLQTVAITAGGGGDRSSNYTVTKNGSYAITAASVTFTVSPTSFNYDGAAHGPTVTPSVGGATYSTSGTASATAVGSYSVSVTGTGNYSGSAGPVAWNIVQVTYTLTTSASGPGSVTPGGTYNAGNGVTITATPQPTGRFIGWTGDASGLSNPLLVTMDANKTITGLFAAKIAQTISFNPPATLRLNGDGSGSLVLSATSTSGLPVRFTLVGGPASLGGATLNFTGAGAVTVQADQDGDATYAAAPAVVRSITTFLAARFKQSEQPDELGDKQKPGSNMVRDRP